MLADKLNVYKGWGNKYVNEHVQEVQDLYKKNEDKKGERVEDKEVILIKPYKVDELTSTTRSSFIDDKVKNLIKYMKFIWSPIQIMIFRPLSHYQSLKSRGEQNPEFWKEIAITLVEGKHNMEMSWNGYPIVMYQGGPPHKPYFITINNQGQVIISLNKKTVVIYVVELEVLI